MPRKIFLIACEPSGDLHGSHLVRALKKLEPVLEFHGLGGPKMAASGVRLLHDMTGMSAVGWGDVLTQYLAYRKIFYQALKEVLRLHPDGLILIDSPAFNLRFAKKINRRFPVIYYISPQIWAWGARRIHTIKRTVDKMLVFFPFEKDLYDKAGVPCEFTGHPLLDHPLVSQTKEQIRTSLKIHPSAKTIGLMPGSRQKEVERILPELLEAAWLLNQKLPETEFFLSQSENVPESLYQTMLEKFPDLKVRSTRNRFYETVAAMDFAFVASGTATLETALIGTPFFLVYKTGWLTYWLGKSLIRVSHLGIVNILAGREVVPEFIQEDLKGKLLAEKALAFLKNPAQTSRMRDEFLKIKSLLGTPGASARAAEAVLAALKPASAFQSPFASR